MVALSIDDGLNLTGELQTSHAVFDDSDLFSADTGSSNVIDSGAQVDDTEVIAKDRNEDNISEGESSLDSVILRRMSIENEHVEILIGKSGIKSRPDFESRKRSLCEPDGLSEVLLFIEVNSEDAKVRGRSDFS